METWPSSLTGFTDDYSIQPNTVAEKSFTDGGVNHAFSRWTSDIVEISGTLHYGQDDLATFKTFYRDTIKNGTEAFYLTDFPIFGDYETHEVVFKEHPNISYAAWMEWDVSVTLLSSDLGYMTEAAMTALLPEEPDDDYVTFPASVFGEVTDDFGWQQDDLIARGNTDGGDFPFQKRISHVSSTTAPWGIEVSRANMNLFYAWGLYKLAGFKKWFKVELPYGGTTQTVTARFVEPPKASFKGRGNADEGLWSITGSLEIYEVNYWALEDCDSLPVRTELEIVAQPESASVSVGDSFTLTVSAVGTAPVTYQWYLDGFPISGATASSYYVESATEDDLGSYYVIITDATGFVISSSVYVGTFLVTEGLVFELDSSVNITTDGTSVTAWQDVDGERTWVGVISSPAKMDTSDTVNGYNPVCTCDTELQASGVGMPYAKEAATISMLVKISDYSTGVTTWSNIGGYNMAVIVEGSTGYFGIRYGPAMLIYTETRVKSGWHLLTMTYTGNDGERGTIALYLDGTEIGSAQRDFSTYTYEIPFSIGGSGYSQGTMNVPEASFLAVAGWSAALSAEEIAELVSWANSKYGLSLT